MANHYDINDSVLLEVDFTVDDVLTDPTEVTLEVLHPDETKDTYTFGAAEIDKDATGEYSKVVLLDAEGFWHYKFSGTGAVVAVDEGYLVVSPTAIS
jgi:hypothetical protein